MTPLALIERVRDERAPVAKLARALSLAAHIDVVRVRSLRRSLFEHASVTIEADLWTSPLIATRSGTEMALLPDVQAAFWDELRADRAELERCSAALARSRPSGRPLLALEEQLLVFVLEGRVDAIEDALASVVKAMLDDEARRRDLAAWSARALARLPALVRNTEQGRILAAAAAGWVARAPDVASAATPKPENVRLVQRLQPSDKRASLALRRVGNVLEVGGSPATRSVLIDIPVVNPILIIDEDVTHRVDLRGLTTIPVQRESVMIGTADGRRWLLGPEQKRPNLHAIGEVLGLPVAVAAYLVSPTLAVTSAVALGDDGSLVGNLRFGTNTVRAKAIAFDHDADVALLQLATTPGTTPLDLCLNPRAGDSWHAFAPGNDPTHTTRSAGTLLAIWPRVTLHMDPLDVALLGRPGLPIFVGDEVIAHTRAHQVDGQELRTTSARLVKWWLEQLERRDQPAAQAEASRQVWFDAVLESDELPNQRELSHLHEARIDDWVLVFVASNESIWPAGLYEVGLQTSRVELGNATARERRASLVMRLSRPSDELLRASSAMREVSRLYHLDSGRGFRNGHDANAREIIWRLTTELYGDLAEGERLRALLRAPYQQASDQRSLPVVLELPERVSTDGLIGTLTTRAGELQRFHTHRWGAHDVRLATITHMVPPDANELRVRIRTTGPSEVAGNELSATLYRRSDHTDPFLFACERAFFAANGSRLPVTARSDAASDVDVDLIVGWLQGLSAAYACRRGIQMVVEALSLMDADAEPVLESNRGSRPATGYSRLLQVKRSVEHDIAECQRRLGAVPSQERVKAVWIDPETDYMKVVLDSDTTDLGAPVFASIVAALKCDVHRVLPSDPEDALGGRFGYSAARGFRSLSVALSENTAIVTVRADGDHKFTLRGYVTFYYPIWTRIDASIHSIRVRASDGIAVCELPRTQRSYSVGAVVEDEGIALQSRVECIQPSEPRTTVL